MTQIKSSQEILDSLIKQQATPERILEIMMRRADRHLDYYEKTKERYKKLKEEHRALLRASGRLVTVKVDHMAHDNWGSYVWYKFNKYRYECDGIWKKCKNKESPNHMATHRHGIFNVNILLEEEDMPEVFIGKCTGSVFGEKVITAKGHMIGYGDEFELRKVKNAV